MKNLIDFFRRNRDFIFKTFLLFLTTAIIVYMFPREGKFRYEFQKGKPWMHEALIAPFDFPVYKSDAQITAERDSLLKTFKPFFVYDSLVFQTQVRAFQNEFDSKWEGLDVDEYRKINVGRFTFVNSRLLASIKFDFNTTISHLLSFIYSKGVLAELDDNDLSKFSEEEIVILRNNFAEDTPFAEVFTQKSAYEYLIREASIRLNSLNNLENLNSKLLGDLNLNEFIQPNLNFDKDRTEKAQQNLVSSISLTEGMIQEGERIVSRGDLVTSENFRILESLRHEYEIKLGSSANLYLIIFGQFILVFISILVIFLFLGNFRKEVFQNKIKTIFIIILVILITFVSRMTLNSNNISIYLIPFALVPIIIKTFYDARLALFIHMVCILLVGFWAPNGFEFVFLNFVAGIVAIFSLTNLYQRGKLFFTAVLIVIAYVSVYLGIRIIQEGSFATIDWGRFLWFGGNGLLILTSYPLIYIFEKLFGFLSDATLMELSDTNQPLLRKLAEVAPGSFQHSLQVSNLAEEAIILIGGNPLLVRTGALYHDIGKMENPIYFVENQNSDISPHNKLDNLESAEIIIGHVEKGVEIAKKHNLPDQIIDFIRTHHGTSTVQYFYKNYVKEFPNAQVDLGKFKYPGPKPFSKETVVLMMADSVEAASRSLKEVNIDTIEQLVEGIVEYQLAEEQFAEADITYREITKIKEVFKKKLQNIHHARIEYPE